MAAEISSVRKRKPDGFMTLLSSAACEWFLMFLMFVDAALSYLLVKFAQYCELETPCLLCSRLDNGFGEKKPGFYWSLLCSNHREEISSLVSCSIHGKFADIHSICEECLTPIAVQNKSNPESQRLLVGKSWVDVDRSVLQNLMLNKHIRCASDVRTCSCCNKTWRTKSNAERLVEVNPIGFGASKANVKPPLPRAPGCSRFSRRDSLKRLRDKFTGPTTHHPPGRSTVGGVTLSHVGYTKLKISSDSESEFPFSEDDDDGGNTDYSSKNYGKSEHNVQYNNRRLSKPGADSEDLEKRMHQGFEVKTLTLDQPNLLDSSEHKNVNSFSSDALIEHGVRDHDQEESYNKPSPSLTPELVSSCDGLQLLDLAEGFFGASAETSKCSDSLSHLPVISVLSELLSLCNVPPLSSNPTIPNQIYAGGASEEGDTSGANHIEATAGTSSDDAHLSETIDMHQIDASTQTDENLELSDRNALEPTNNCDSDKTEEDRPQVSTSELSSLSNKISDRANHKNEERRIDEGSSSQVLPVSASLKKNDSTYRFPDGITVSNAEGEDIVDQLKHQTEHDQNCMSSLYKELEEERNAAAIAANEAMAMITRLQEEKAALHMEALQYLRMMEEQAEYDMDALERANDLLAEKDKEMKDLEHELEFYRNNFLDKSGVQNVQETSSLDNRVAAQNEMSPRASSNSKADKILRPNGNCKPMNSSVSNFQDEKIYSHNV